MRLGKLNRLATPTAMAIAMAVGGLLPQFGCAGIYSTEGILNGDFINAGGGPSLIRPRNAERIFYGDYFSWEPAADATKSLIEISRDSDFQSLVVAKVVEASFWQLPLEDATAAFDLEAGEFYWRVKSGGQYSDISSFNVMETNVIYVSAAADSQQAIGNQVHPFASLDEAAEFIFTYYADGTEQITVRMAGGQYSEPLVLTGQLLVMGGYNPQTWERNVDEQPTTINQVTADGAVQAFGGGESVVDGLTIINTEDYPGRYYGVVGAAGGTLTVRNSRITNTGLGLGCYGIIALDNGVVTIEDSTITVNTACDETAAGVITISQGRFDITNSRVTVEDGSTLYGTLGLAASQGGSFSAHNTAIDVSGVTAFGVSAGFLAGVDAGEVELESNRVSVTATTNLSRGISCKGESITIRNNAIYLSADSATVISVDQGTALIEQNTVFTTGSNGTLLDVSTSAQVMGNIFAGSTTGTGIAEDSFTSTVTVLEQNLIYDVPTLFIDMQGGGGLTSIADLNNSTLTTQGDASSSTGNLTAADSTAVFGTIIGTDIAQWTIVGGGPADVDASGGWTSGDIGADIENTGIGP